MNPQSQKISAESIAPRTTGIPTARSRVFGRASLLTTINGASYPEHIDEFVIGCAD